MDFLNTPSIQMWQKVLDSKALGQRVIANNIANVDTPGFKRSEVEFSTILQEAMNKNNITLRTTNPRHINSVNSLNKVEPKIILDNSTSIRNDGNNVDIDREMSGLAKNQLEYQIASDLLSRKFTGLKKIIQSGP